MKKIILLVLVCIFFYFNACNTKKSLDTSMISADSATIAKGHNLFFENCSACHNLKQNGIGPRLSGLTAEMPADWIMNFIQGPKTIIESGDERAKKLLERFKTTMPSFDFLSAEDVNAIIAFLHTQKAPENTATKGEGKELTDPLPEHIELSDLVVGLEFMTQMPSTAEQKPVTRITKLDFQPNTEKLFVLDLRGKLYELQNNVPVMYLDLAKLKSKFIHQPGLATGFGSFAFHPEFAKNGLLYTTHTEPPASAKADFGFADSIKVTLQWVLSEWKTKQPGASPFIGESRELFRVNMVTGIHGVQEITFNPLAHPGDKDYGLLYVGVGDGGSVEEGFALPTQGPERIWGSILRIDPKGRNSNNHQYGIPDDNPYSQGDKTRTVREIYATGFRNPHKITWSKAGQMLAVNIGQHNIESLYLVQPGRFYGWPIREGTFVLKPFESMDKVYPLPANDSIYHVTYPVAEYDHDEGVAISGGFEYSGSTLPEFSGKYLFGDVNSGRLFYVEMADVKLGSQATIKEWQISVDGVRKPLLELVKNNRVDMRFGRDSRGELYLLTKTDGKIYRFVKPKGI